MGAAEWSWCSGMLAFLPLSHPQSLCRSGLPMDHRGHLWRIILSGAFLAQPASDVKNKPFIFVLEILGLS